MNNSQDMIDSRDVIARIEELEGEREALADTITDDAEDLTAEELADARRELAEWDEENTAELGALLALASEGEDYAADWNHGETLIRDSYFETYAQELAEDIGATDRDAKWPQTCIDWEQAARELQMDYSSVDFDGVTYWIR